MGPCSASGLPDGRSGRRIPRRTCVPTCATSSVPATPGGCGARSPDTCCPRGLGRSGCGRWWTGRGYCLRPKVPQGGSRAPKGPVDAPRAWARGCRDRRHRHRCGAQHRQRAAARLRRPRRALRTRRGVGHDRRRDLRLRAARDTQADPAAHPRPTPVPTRDAVRGAPGRCGPHRRPCRPDRVRHGCGRARGRAGLGRAATGHGGHRHQQVPAEGEPRRGRRRGHPVRVRQGDPGHDHPR